MLRHLPTDPDIARQTLRDIVALSTLPAIWSGAEPTRVAESLAASLFTTVNPEFVYVGFAGQFGQPVGVAQTDRHHTDPALAARLGPVLLDRARAHDPDDPLVLSHPVGDGDVRVLVRPLGHEADFGVLAAGFLDRDDAPTPTQRLILSVAASQATIAIRNTFLLDEVRANEQRYRSLTEATSSIVWTVDREGRFVVTQPGWAAYTGQSWEEYRDFGWTNALHPHDRQPVRERWQAASIALAPYQVTARLWHAATKTYRHIEARAVPVPRPGGSVTEWVGMCVDVEDRIQAERALRDEAEVRETLARVGASLATELNPDAVLQAVTDASTRLTGAEFGAFFYNVTEPSGESYLLYTLSGAPKEAFARFPHPRATALFGPTFRGEAVIRLDDVTADPRYGENPPYHGMPAGHLPVRSYLAVPVVSRTSGVIGALFFGHSTPGVFAARHEQLAVGIAAWAAIALENARLYRDLEQANRVKDEFLATLSHELRTPLNAMLGWAHMLARGALKPEIQARAMESLERNARAQAQLVDDLLDMSRIMSGKLAIKADVVDLGAVVSGALDSIRPAAAAKRLAVQLAIERDTRIFVTGDADRLQQVVWNLLSNAVKFTPLGGRVDVTLRRAGSTAEVVVSDTGPGIDPEFRPYLFQRFRQADRGPARKHGGLGIGLAIVRHLTEAHGGTVAVEGPAIDAGATFVVRLPIRAVRANVDDEAAGTTRLHPTVLANVRVLVVDDVADARELVRFVLEERGATVVTAASAGEAMDLFVQQRFDVVVADIGMPEQDGYWLIRAIRDLPRGLGRHVRAIALTAYASAADRDGVLEAGYDCHLAKPVEPDQLVEAISSLPA